MCCIIIVPRHTEIPSETVLKQVYAHNRDGMGFVSETNYFRTFDFNEFVDELQKVPTSENIIIHFRWATHGSVKIANCHPFVGYASGKEYFFAHNGVLPIPSKNDKTDSEICFRERILPAIRRLGFEGAKKYIDHERNGSRFAIMRSDGEVELFGNYQYLQGCLFSNFRWAGN